MSFIQFYPHIMHIVWRKYRTTCNIYLRFDHGFIYISMSNKIVNSYLINYNAMSCAHISFHNIRYYNQQIKTYDQLMQGFTI